MWIERDVLIVVKAYPEPSAIYKETVCAAAISRDEGLIRLYPIQFRTLTPSRRFAKYQLVRLKIAKHERDPRPESYRPDQDSISLGRKIGTSDGWRERRKWVERVAGPSMCEILREQRISRQSLGIVKPREVTDVTMRHVGTEWTGRQKAKIDQLWFDDLTGRKPLEKIPFEARYRYFCQDDKCTGHHQKIIDWELGQLYRRLKKEGGSIEEVQESIRDKFLNVLCGESRDPHFFVGNHSRFWRSFMVLGVFWPPKQSPSLFAT